MRHNSLALGLALLALILLFISACGAKDEAETWLEEQQDNIRQEAEQVASDIEDFFSGSGGGGCAAAPLAVSVGSLALATGKRRSSGPGSDPG